MTSDIEWVESGQATVIIIRNGDDAPDNGSPSENHIDPDYIGLALVDRHTNDGTVITGSKASILNLLARAIQALAAYDPDEDGDGHEEKDLNTNGI